MARVLLLLARRLMVSFTHLYRLYLTLRESANIIRPTVTLQLSEADFGSLVSGKANAQKLFMGGKLKIKGNIMKATKMEPVLKKAQGKAKL